MFIKHFQKIALCLLILFLTPVPLTYAALIDAVTCDRDSGLVTVEGQLPKAEAKQKVTVRVLRPGVSDADLRNAQPDDYAGLIDIEDQTLTGSGGNYIYQYMLSGNGSGTYKVNVSWTDAEARGEMEFYYAAPEDVAAALALLKAADVSKNAANLRQALESEARILGLDFSLYNTLTDKNKVAQLTINDAAAGKYDSAGNFAAVFDRAVVVQAANESDESGIALLMANFGDILQFSAKSLEAYNNGLYFDDSGRRAVRRAVASEYAFNSVKDVQDAFDEQVILQAILRINWTYIHNLLYNSEAVNLNFTKYNALTDAQKAEVDKRIAGSRFNSTGDVRMAFDKYCGAFTPSGGSGASGGSGLGGAGGGASIDYVKRGGADETGNAATVTPPVDVKRFNDLGTVPWAGESIEFLAEKGIVHGDGDGRFEPDALVLREQFVKMLILCFGLEDETAVADFDDVPPGAWYYTYVARAQKVGIVNGLDGGSFGAGRNITRQEMAVMVCRAVDAMNFTLPVKTAEFNFTDEEDIDGYAAECVKALQRAGVVNGTDGGRFDPGMSSTRAQAAKIIYELMKSL
jgi:hypothetical protein